MHFQLESVREQSLQHRLYLFLRRRRLRSALNLVMVAMYPRRTTVQFIVLIEDAVGPKNCPRQSDDHRESLRFNDCRHVLLPGFDGSDFERQRAILRGRLTWRRRMDHADKKRAPKYR